MKNRCLGNACGYLHPWQEVGPKGIAGAVIGALISFIFVVYPLLPAKAQPWFERAVVGLLAAAATFCTDAWGRLWAIWLSGGDCCRRLGRFGPRLVGAFQAVQEPKRRPNRRRSQPEQPMSQETHQPSGADGSVRRPVRWPASNWRQASAAHAWHSPSEKPKGLPRPQAQGWREEGATTLGICSGGINNPTGLRLGTARSPETQPRWGWRGVGPDYPG